MSKIADPMYKMPESTNYQNRSTRESNQSKWYPSRSPNFIHIHQHENTRFDNYNWLQRWKLRRGHQFVRVCEDGQMVAVAGLGRELGTILQWYLGMGSSMWCGMGCAWRPQSLGTVCSHEVDSVRECNDGDEGEDQMEKFGGDWVQLFDLIQNVFVNNVERTNVCTKLHVNVPLV